MRRNARPSITTRKVDALGQDEALVTSILGLEKRDRHRAALAAVEGVLQERLSTDDETTTGLVHEAIEMLKKFIAIRDVTAHPENGEDITVDGILDKDSVVQMNAFSNKWQLIKYEVSGGKKDTGQGSGVK